MVAAAADDGGVASNGAAVLRLENFFAEDDVGGDGVASNGRGCSVAG